mgnify:FL=1
MKRIDFQKLINREYGLTVELFMINWMLKTGIPYSERTGRWNVDGVSKFILGYSANNHTGSTMHTQPLSIENIDMQVDGILSRAIVKTTDTKCINQWRQDERIYLNKYRYFDIDEDVPFTQRGWYLSREIKGLNDFIGKDLSTEYNHRSFINPRISKVYFHVNGHGYQVECYVSYGSENHKFNYTQSDFIFSQKDGESVDIFIYRCKEFINSKLIEL